jgi:NitT/TauT family transport system substrate-binding protein
MRARYYLLTISLFAVLASSNPAFAQEKVRLGLGFLTASAGGVFGALEAGSFKKHGLDVTSIFIQSSAIILPALLSGEVDMITIAPQTVFRAFVQGSKNIVITGTLVKKFTFALYVKPNITSAAGLRGKRIGVTRYGGSLDLGLRFALKELDLNPERDKIVIPQVGRLTDLVLALKTGRLDAAMLTSVYALEAEEAGFKKLIDLGDSDIEFPQGAIATTREVIGRRKEMVKNFMSGYREGLQLFLSKEEFGKQVLAKFTGTKSQKVLEADYKNFATKYISKDPTTTRTSMELVFDSLGIKEPEEKKRIFESIVDNSFL